MRGKKRLVPGEKVLVAIKDIQKASFNPPSRTEKAELSALAKSIKMVGILVPLILDTKFNLIDGHRRLAIAILMGLTHVECVIRDIDQRSGFKEINTTARAMIGNEVLHLYLVGGPLIDRCRNKVNRAEMILGRKLLVELQAEGYSLAPYGYAIQANTKIYGKGEANINKEFVRKAVQWQMKYGVQAFSVAVRGSTKPDVIKRAVMEDLPLNDKGMSLGN